MSLHIISYSRCQNEVNNPKTKPLSIYAHEDNKPKEEREEFHIQIQEIIEKTPQNKQFIVLLDFNARADNEILGVKQRFNINMLNPNGELMINPCSSNELRINNTNFEYKTRY